MAEACARPCRPFSMSMLRTRTRLIGGRSRQALNRSSRLRIRLTVTDERQFGIHGQTSGRSLPIAAIRRMGGAKRYPSFGPRDESMGFASLRPSCALRATGVVRSKQPHDLVAILGWKCDRKRMVRRSRHLADSVIQNCHIGHGVRHVANQGHVRMRYEYGTVGQP